MTVMMMMMLMEKKKIVVISVNAVGKPCCGEKLKKSGKRRCLEDFIYVKIPKAILQYQQLSSVSVIPLHHHHMIFTKPAHSETFLPSSLIISAPFSPIA